MQGLLLLACQLLLYCLRTLHDQRHSAVVSMAGHLESRWSALLILIL